jgi:hypothetical protein
MVLYSDMTSDGTTMAMVVTDTVEAAQTMETALELVEKACSSTKAT